MYRYTYTYACTLRNVIGKVLWHTCCLTFKMAWHTASLFCLPGPIIHYILFRDGRERFQGTALSFTDTQGIQPLQEYSYQLKACTAAGCAVSCKVRRAHLTMGRRVQGQGYVNEHLGYELSKARKPCLLQSGTEESVCHWVLMLTSERGDSDRNLTFYQCFSLRPVNF